MSFKSRVAPCGGYTLIELVIVLALISIVLMNLYLVSGASSAHSGSQFEADDVERNTRRATERIRYELLGASIENLYQTVGAPASVTEINYQQSLGMEQGEWLWSDPLRIAYDPQTRQVTWCENPGESDERRQVWLKDVPQLAPGELLNGIDDNQDGLVDESGLSFFVHEGLVTATIHVMRPLRDGTLVVRQGRITVKPRN
jgi:prepilin-type N-terminal cleavage/methylation domain-containing protein